jgi:hypothetical protein
MESQKNSLVSVGFEARSRAQKGAGLKTRGRAHRVF